MARVVTRVVCRRRRGAVFDVYVGRPSIWGNPYAVDCGVVTRAQFVVPTLSVALHLYEEYMARHRWLVDKARAELRGCVLGCWCVDDLLGTAPIVCHAQIIARVADGAELPVMRGRK